MATEEPKERPGWSPAGMVTIGALAALDVVFGPENNLSGSFGVAPFLTAVGGHLAATAVVAFVGGDLYSLVRCGGGPRLLVGDVRGKGLEAVQLAAAAIRAFHDAAPTTEHMEDLPRRFEEVLLPLLGPEDFLTCLMLEFGANHTMTVVNCGHPPPLVLSPEGTISLDAPTAVPPVGLGTSAVVTRIVLVLREPLLLYTDGLVESRDVNGSFISPEEVLEGLNGQDFEDIVNKVVQRLEERTGGRIRDDLALVLIEASSEQVLPAHPQAGNRPKQPPTVAVGHWSSW